MNSQDGMRMHAVETITWDVCFNAYLPRTKETNGTLRNVEAIMKSEGLRFASVVCESV
jgi:hypothetical protein